MADAVDVDQPVRPLCEDRARAGQRGRGLVGGGDEAPGVAGHEERDDGEGDAGEAVLLPAHAGVVGRVALVEGVAGLVLCGGEIVVFPV